MTDPDLQARKLSDAWDARIRGEHGTESDDALLRIVDELELENRQIELNQTDMSSIWSGVMAGSVAEIVVQAETATASDTGRFGRNVRALVSLVTRYAWIIVAGMVGGFIAGVGSRLTMRLAGSLTVDSNKFRLTENDARVGELTLSGTMTLGMIGAALGVCALLFYVLIKERIPFTGWQRSAAFAWLLLFVFGYVVMDPSNPDYQLFGPTWLNVFTFSSLYLVLGFCVAQIYEAGLRWRFRNPDRFNGGFVGILKIVLSTAISLIGTVMLVPALFLGAGMLLIPLIAAAIWLVSKVLGRVHITTVEMPVLVRQWGIWVIPGIVGFILTARGITGILMG